MAEPTSFVFWLIFWAWALGAYISYFSIVESEKKQYIYGKPAAITYILSFIAAALWPLWCWDYFTKPHWREYPVKRDNLRTKK